jgi:cytochrome b561
LPDQVVIYTPEAMNKHPKPTSRLTRYGAFTQTLHWLTAILVLVAFIYGLGGSETRVYSVAKDFERQLHETLGLAVFFLVLIRVVWRLLDQRPEPLPVTRWMGLASKAVQLGLYFLLFAVPLTAIAGAWLEGHPVTLLTGVEIAPLLPLAHDLGANVANIHTWLGDSILWLAGFHALAAIYHHFLLKDGVLLSMLPRWLTRKSSEQA